MTNAAKRGACVLLMGLVMGLSACGADGDPRPVSTTGTTAGSTTGITLSGEARIGVGGRL